MNNSGSVDPFAEVKAGALPAWLRLSPFRRVGGFARTFAYPARPMMLGALLIPALIVPGLLFDLAFLGAMEPRYRALAWSVAFVCGLLMYMIFWGVSEAKRTPVPLAVWDNLVGVYMASSIVSFLAISPE